MRICLLTYGSRGDVEPFLALAAGLLQAGYTVTLAAPGTYRRLDAPRGLEFYGLDGDPAELARGLANQAGLNWLRSVGVMARYVFPLAAGVFRQLQTACREADLVVHSFLLTEAGHQITRARDIPEFSAQFFPVFSPTAAFPTIGLPDLRLGKGLTGLYRRLSHHFNNLVFRSSGRFLYGLIRRTHPDLPRLPAWPFGEPPDQRPPVLYAISEHVLPRPLDWAADAHMTGYWQRSTPVDWEPPEALARWLEENEPPLYFGLGSMVPDPETPLLEMLAAIARRVGRRGICAVEGIGADHPIIRGDLLLTGAVPHAWLFPRMGAVIHHGGAGTTASGLRAGVPNLVLPVSADQAFWGRRVAELGAGPAPLLLRELNQDRLERAVHQALFDPDLAENARRLGARLQAESGVDRAVELIANRLKA